MSRTRRVGLIAGPLILATLLLLEPPAGMSEQAWRTAAAAAFMACWWMTEAVPLAATALTPLVLFPLLGILGIGATAAPYANPVIFLFLGGFILALAMQRHDLHRRIALGVVRALGLRPPMLVLGFMLATAFLSMWVSNTATTVMMLPIGLSVVQLLRGGSTHGDAARGDDTGAGETPGGDPNFGTALMLGIAYAASIGGLATLIGTPPNALLAGFMLETYAVEIGFAQWMLVGTPLAALALPLCWLLLVRGLYPVRQSEIPGGGAAIRAAYDELGPLTPAQRRVGALFVATALLWIFRPMIEEHVAGLSDTGIAIAAALATFFIPSGRGRGDFLLDWPAAEKLPWGVLLLFGGGLSLADAITRTGLAEWIGTQMSVLNAWPFLAIVVLVTTVVILLTELTSNTATAAAFLPLIAPLAIGLGENPLLLLVPAAIAASCAFMLPVATPPNAIVYGSGRVTMQQMTRAGVRLNVMFVLLITLLVYTLVARVFGIEPGVVPEWAAGGGV